MLFNSYKKKFGQIPHDHKTCYCMENELKNKSKKIKYSRACTTTPIESSSIPITSISSYPNFLIDKESNKISVENMRPDNSSEIKLDELFNKRIEEVNNLIETGLPMASGIIYARRIDKKTLKFKDDFFFHSTFSVIELNGKLRGLTCLHLISNIKEPFEDYHFYVSFKSKLEDINLYDKESLMLKYLKGRMIKVELCAKFLAKRKKFLVDMSNKNKHEALHLDDLHPNPSVDILVFKFPENFTSENKFKLEMTKEISDDQFAFFIGYHCSKVKLAGDEYAKTFDVNMTSRDLVYIGLRTVTFGKVEFNKDKTLGKIVCNSFEGASGSLLINTKGQLIGMIVSSFSDIQTMTEEELDKTKQELDDRFNASPECLHRFDLPHCNTEKLIDRSYNYNIYVNFLYPQISKLLMSGFED